MRTWGLGVTGSAPGRNPAGGRSSRSAPTITLSILILCNWQPNVQVLGTCGDLPSICAESDSLGLVVVADAPAPPCHWQTVGADRIKAGECEVEVR